MLCFFVFILFRLLGNLENSVIYVGTKQFKTEVKEEAQQAAKEIVAVVDVKQEEARAIANDDDEDKDDSVIYVGTTFVGSPMTLMSKAFGSLKIEMKKRIDS